MFTAFDIDGNGRIAFWEFVRSLGTTVSPPPSLPLSQAKGGRA